MSLNLPACIPAARLHVSLVAAPTLFAVLLLRRDGLNLFIRSVVLQLTFFLALAAASRLGTATLAGGLQQKPVHPLLPDVRPYAGCGLPFP